MSLFSLSESHHYKYVHKYLYYKSDIVSYLAEQLMPEATARSHIGINTSMLKTVPGVIQSLQQCPREG